jgi:hypothetical protein
VRGMRLIKSENIISLICMILLSVNCIIGYKINSYKRNFSFTLRYGHEEVLGLGPFEYTIKGKNIINTKYDTFTKDLIRRGSVRTYLKFTEEEMNRIKDFIDSHGIMNYPEEIKSPMRRYPKSICSLTIYYEGKAKKIEWMPMRMTQPLWDIYLKDDVDTKHKLIVLNELYDLIIGILHEKEEYKRLPRHVGGYL